MNFFKGFFSALCRPILPEVHPLFGPVYASNILIITLSLVSFPYVFIFMPFSKLLGFLVAIIVFLYIASLYIGRRGFYKTSRLSFITISSFAMWLYASAFGSAVGIQSLLFLFSPASAVICYRKEKAFKLFLAAIPILFFLLLVSTDFNNGLIRIDLPENVATMLYPLNAVLVAIMCCILLNTVSTSRQEEIEYSRQVNRTLSDTNTQLEKANISVREKEKYEVEFNIAAKIQQEFLPEVPDAIDGYKLDFIYWPSREISGDHIDLKIVGDLFCILMADVAGKGLAASFITLIMHSVMRSEISKEDSPSQAMSKFNASLCNTRSSRSKAAAAYVQLDTKTHTFKYSNAGIGYFYHFSNNQTQELTTGGIMLGGINDSDYEEASFKVAVGDIIAIGSDGITDLQNTAGERFGESRLTHILSSYDDKNPKWFHDSVKTVLKDFQSGSTLKDDVIFLLLRRAK